MECNLYRYNHDFFLLLLLHYNHLTKTIYCRTEGTMIGTDCGDSDLINKIDLVNRHRRKSSANDLLVTNSSATIPDPDPNLDPFPEENCQVIHCEDRNNRR